MAEQRLIEAEALYKKVLESHVTNIDGYSYINHNRVLKMIDNEPTVDAKPVVHCKDCCCFSYMGSINRYYCDCYGGYVTDEDYCSRPTPKNSNCGAQMDEEENDNG